MKNRAWILGGIWMSVCVCLFTACHLKEKEYDISMAEASHYIYAIDDDHMGLEKLPYEILAYTPEERVEKCIDALKKESKTLNSIPILKYEYKSDEQRVLLYLDESYGTMEPSLEVQIRAAVVKTLTQFSDEIRCVTFVVGDQTWATMKNQDFVFNIGGNQEYICEDYVNMFFINDADDLLESEYVIIKYSSKINLETAVVNSLISGPVTQGLEPSVSPDTKMNKVYVKEGICYVDLDSHFLESVDGRPFRLSVYSVVNTLACMPEISGVQFLIDGEIYEDEVEGMSIAGLFEKDMTMIHAENEVQEKNSDLTKDIEKKMIEDQKNIQTGD